jgi:hypothetical protein
MNAFLQCTATTIRNQTTHFPNSVLPRISTPRQNFVEVTKKIKKTRRNMRMKIRKRRVEKWKMKMKRI